MMSLRMFIKAFLIAAFAAVVHGFTSTGIRPASLTMSIHSDIQQLKFEVITVIETVNRVDIRSPVNIFNSFKSTIRRFRRKVNDFVISCKYYIAFLLLVIAKKLVGLKGIRDIGRIKEEGAKEKLSYVYCLALENDMYYIGSTTDMIARWAEHTLARGSKLTAMYKPVRIDFAESVPSSQDVAGRELQLTAKQMMKYGM